MKRLFCVVAAMLAVSICLHASDAVDWKHKVTPGPAVKLRLKRAVGKYLIYEGALSHSQQAKNSYKEDDHFYLNLLCADHQDGRDLMAISRTFTDRKRIEKLENGKSVDRVLANSNELINLGPNFSTVATLRCYPFDSMNRIAHRTASMLQLADGGTVYGTLLSEDNTKFIFLADNSNTEGARLEDSKLELPREKVLAIAEAPKPHFITDESTHYFFPMFSERAVAPGESWRFRIPMIIPIEPSASKIFPTQFMAVYTARLREVRDVAGTQIAIVDYRVEGLFDSNDAEFSARFSDKFTASNQIIHKISGEGSASIDVEKGRLIDKSEAFVFTIFASGIVQPNPDKPGKEEKNQAEKISRFDLKLLPSGSRLKSGAIIPPYDDDEPAAPVPIKAEKNSKKK